jgi:hypothetical protein
MNSKAEIERIEATSSGLRGRRPRTREERSGRFFVGRRSKAVKEGAAEPFRAEMPKD